MMGSRVAILAAVESTAMRRLSVALLTLVVAFVSRGTGAQGSPDALKSWAAAEAKAIRERSDYQHAGCYVDAILGHVIVRSNDPHLRRGDRVVSIAGGKVSDEDNVLRLVTSQPPSGKVTFGVVRGGKPTSVTVQCRNTTQVLSARASVFDAAAAGDLDKCIAESARYGDQYVQHAVIYRVWRWCSLAAGKLTGTLQWATLVEYWTLELQQMRDRPALLEGARSHYLVALSDIENAGQGVLADELRKQWALASGEPLAVPSKRAPRPPSAQGSTHQPAPPRDYTHAAPRRGTGSNCESGHWIDSVMDDGSIIKLEDGSLWRVDDVDTVDSALWLPTTDIIVCDGKLINTEDNESVQAERIE
jgi:hypothetical protein